MKKKTKAVIAIPEKVDAAIKDYQSAMIDRKHRKPTKPAVIEALLVRHQDSVVAWIHEIKSRKLESIDSLKNPI